MPPNESPPSARPSSGSGKRTDRELVAEALRAARPRVEAPLVIEEKLPPTDAFPGYEILREIHRGGQGVVYQAIQKATTRKVAIKVLHGGPFTGSKGRARFEREIAILAQLQHPNIVSILDSGTSVGQAFYVMDYVSGQTLDAWMAGEPRPIDDVLPMFSKICDAVNAAHLRGITHRDLKPSNIRIDHSGEPHILDFGLAKVVIGEVTEESQPQMMSMTGQFIGSLPWASPEQAEGAPGKVDLRSDVYSLGVILYQLLTGGKFPYEVVGNMREVMDNILRAEPAKPSTIRRQINDEVETIVLKALQKERERRYQTAGELARDVRRYIAGEPIEAMRDSGWYVIRKTLRRYQMQTAGGAAFLGLLIVSAVVSYLLYQRAEDKRLIAEGALSDRAAALAVAETQKDRAERAAERYRKVTDAGRALRRVAYQDYARRLEQIVGTTEARKKLLDGALAYLATLKTELSDDPAYLEELAEAHEAVSRLQTGLYLPRVGETNEGVENLRAAIEIRERLLEREPGSVATTTAIARLLVQLSTAERVAQRFEEAVKHAERARAMGKKAIGLAAQDADRRSAEDAWASAVQSLGELAMRRAVEVRGRDADGAKVLLAESESLHAEVAELVRQRLAADPKQAAMQRMAVVCDDKVTQVRQTLGDVMLAEALALAQRGDARAGGAFDAALRAYSESVASGKQCQSAFARLSASSPSAAARRDMCVNLRNVGGALTASAAAAREYGVETGTWEKYHQAAAQALAEAEGPLTESLAIARELAGADRSNVEAQRAVYVCLNSVSNHLRETGVLRMAAGDRDGARQALDGAAAAARESVELRLRMVSSDRTQLHRRDLAMGYDKLGHALLEAGNLTDAAAAFRRALDELDALVAERAFDAGSRDYGEIKERFQRASAGAGNLK